MKCPLWVMAYKIYQCIFEPTGDECLKEECAWWDEDNSQCGVTTLGKGIWILDQLVTGIVNKMPHAGQFTR